MAREPIRFRCYRCQKLLGVSPSKGGATVNCPKCGVELLVPEITPLMTLDTDEDASRLFQNLLSTQPIPGEFPEFGPEDIRPLGDRPRPPIDGSKTFELSHSTGAFPIVDATRPPPSPPGNDPESGESATSEATDSEVTEIDTDSALRAPAAGRPRLDPEGDSEPLFPAIRTEPRPILVVEPPRRVDPAPRPAITVAAPPPAARSPHHGAPALSGLRIEPGGATAGSRPEASAGAARRDDVALPRSAVLLGSLAAVLGIVSAFVAGLLAGHFVWVARP